MIQRAKIEVFGHFLEFGLLYRLGIAYCDSTKWSLQLRYNIVQAGSFKNHQKCIFE